MFSRMHTSCKNLYLIKWECFVSNKLDPLPYYYQNINALFKYWKVSLNCTVRNHINRGIHLLLSLDQSDSFANVLGDSYQCCILGRSMHSWDFKDQPRKLKMCICIEETFTVTDTYLIYYIFFFFFIWIPLQLFCLVFKVRFTYFSYNQSKDRAFSGRDCRFYTSVAPFLPIFIATHSSDWMSGLYLSLCFFSDTVQCIVTI